MKEGEKIKKKDVKETEETENVKSEFIAVVSHRMRNPMSSIKWYAESLLAGDCGQLPKKQECFVKQILLSNRRLINLMDDLLRVARVEEGKVQLKKRVVLLNRLIKEIILKMKDEIGRKKIIVHYGNNDCRVLADEDKLKQILFNLLDNAIKYNSVGGRVDIKVKKHKSYIVFSIADTGVGIPKNQQKRIFTKFFRANNALTIHTEGNGLSLYLAKAYIESHGGKIWVESKLGEGSIFYFTLPTKLRN
jgi:signal transduction histidine kinase